MAADSIFGKRKPRNPKAERPERPLRQPAPRILLVCEGEKTEPRYFQDMVSSWRLANHVKVGKNDGSSPDRVVLRAEGLYSDALHEGDAFDEVYCVFDRDAHERFADAVARLKDLQAEGQPFNGVVSVPCFEFWLLLHFGYTDKPYVSKGKKSVGNAVVSDLKKKPGFAKYDKGMRGVFGLLAPQLEQALKNAHLLGVNLTDDKAFHNPSTQVHELVNRLKQVSSGKV